MFNPGIPHQCIYLAWIFEKKKIQVVARGFNLRALHKINAIPRIWFIQIHAAYQRRALSHQALGDAASVDHTGTC